ncbi:MAG: tRNA pseudouridine(38-40) synthase TruA [Thermoguttaceae bacterium]|nr:tRNA pseudouridine(38-40) synthase TruA [Thermoguttaceae bacterium]
MRRFKLEICYRGTAYSGWQIQAGQPGVRTVQEELELALEQITGTRPHVSGSGRTDAGVHALYQVAAFSSETRLSPEILTRALNATLPPDIRVWRASAVAESFHPLKNVERKRYRYLMSDSRPAFPFFRDLVWISNRPLELDRMQAAAVFLVGEHDFKAFQTTGSPRLSTVRTVFDLVVERLDVGHAWLAPRQSGRGYVGQNAVPEETVDRANPFPVPGVIAIEVEADGFLYNMVRAIAGTLYLFGQRHKGFDHPAAMKDILECGDRSLAGPTAPPHGLYMIDVRYSKE